MQARCYTISKYIDEAMFCELCYTTLGALTVGSMPPTAQSEHAVICGTRLTSGRVPDSMLDWLVCSDIRQHSVGSNM